MAASQSGVFSLQEFSDIGAPLVGGRLYTYVYGTTTHKTAYTDKAGTIPHTYTSDGIGGQYIALNARGELPAPLYLAAGSYDIALKDASGATIWTRRADPGDDTAGALDAAVRADLASISDANKGAGMVKWFKSVTGFVARWVSDKLFDQLHVKDFGAVCDGVTDDTAALVLADAAAAANKKTLVVSGTPLISATFTPTCSAIQFDGSSGGGTQTSYLIKKATMASAGVVLSVKDFKWIGGGVKALSGATGDGIVIKANGVKVNDAFAIAAGGYAVTSGDGFRVGSDVVGTNANSWELSGCYSGGWSGRGYYIHDKPGSAPDANAGHAINCIAQGCTDGLVEGNAYLNTYTNFLGEGCNAWGMTIGGQDSTVVGGDRESNATGNLQIALGAVRTSLIGVNPSEVGDFSNATKSSISTRRNERYVAVQGTWTPTLAGATTAGTQTYGTRNGYWFRDGDYVLIEGVITLTAMDAATNGNLRITGLPFQIPVGMSLGVFGFTVARWGNFTLDAGYTSLHLSSGPGGAYIDIVECGSGKTSFVLNQSNLTATSQIWFSGRIPINQF